MTGLGKRMSLWLCLAAAGCAPIVPASFRAAESPALAGRVLAMDNEDGKVVVATTDGLFRREAQEAWIRVDAPGIRDASDVTAVAIAGDELFVGTRGDGLHVLSGGTWEVLNARYGGLPGNHVFCLSVGGGGGPFGVEVWVGTGDGLAVRRDGRWEMFRPGERWLWDLVGANLTGEGKVYVTEGFSLGDGTERGTFLPPVRAIGLGRGRVVLGGDSRLAILDAGAYASVRLDGGYQVTSLLVEEGAVWAGTSKGLLWGGRLGIAERFPYPAWRPSVLSTGLVFGGRDSRPYHHVWRQFGFNSARVEGLARDAQSALWVAFNDSDGGYGSRSIVASSTEEAASETSLRRFSNLEEYIEAGDKPHYEVYGKPQGVRGAPTALSISGGSGVLVGTTEGVVVLR